MKNKMYFFVTLLVVVIGAAVLTMDVFVNRAEAVPVFARKTNLACSKCHTAFPKLNNFGREFKSNGYKRSEEKEESQDISESLTLEKVFQAGVLYKVRPYDKKKTDSDFKLRSLHELEVFFAGVSDEVFSYWTEIEAEDETGFEAEIGELEFGYHPNLAFNLLLTNRPISVSDPFQTFSNAGRLTRSNRKIFDVGHSSGELPLEKQTFSVYGTTPDRKFFYSAGVGADMQSGDAEGAGPKDVSARLAYTLPWGLTSGIFLDSGKEKVTVASGTQNIVEKLKFTRTGIDLQLEKENFTLSGAYLAAKDNKHSKKGGGTEKNNGFYLEALFLTTTGEGEEERPSIVPVIRYDKYEKSNGTDYAELTLNLSHYPKENARVFLEYWSEVQKPAGGSKNNRLTLQVEVGF